ACSPRPSSTPPCRRGRPGSERSSPPTTPRTISARRCRPSRRWAGSSGSSDGGEWFGLGREEGAGRASSFSTRAFGSEATMAERQDWNRHIIEEFRANAGKVGGPFVNTPLLLLHHTG